MSDSFPKGPTDEKPEEEKVKDVGTEETKQGQEEVVAGTPEHERLLHQYPNASSYSPEVNVVLPPDPPPEEEEKEEEEATEENTDPNRDPEV